MPLVNKLLPGSVPGKSRNSRDRYLERIAKMVLQGCNLNFRFLRPMHEVELVKLFLCIARIPKNRRTVYISTPLHYPCTPERHFRILYPSSLPARPSTSCSRWWETYGAHWEKPPDMNTRSDESYMKRPLLARKYRRKDLSEISVSKNSVSFRTCPKRLRIKRQLTRCGVVGKGMP